MARRVQTAFGWVVEPSEATPRFFRTPRCVELDVLASATEPHIRGELAELLGLREDDGWGRTDVAHEVLSALTSGRLLYQAWSGFQSWEGPSAAPVDLAEFLEDDEDEVVALHSVVIELVGEDDEPIPHAVYQLVRPDGRTQRGRLDAEGRAECHDIRKGGTCKVCFPELDEEAWEYISAVPL